VEAPVVNLSAGYRFRFLAAILVSIFLLSVHSETQVAAASPQPQAGWGEYRWLNFKADGFTHPVTGVIYRDGASVEGVPLGGLGTGFISLQTDGTLDYYSTIFNAWLEDHYFCLRKESGDQAFTRHESDLPSLRLPFLGISVASKTWVLSIADSGKNVLPARHIEYWGHYPVADLKYETDAPVSVKLRAWAPFFPGDAEASSIPGAVFEVQLQNTSDKQQQGRIGFSFHGPRNDEIAFNQGVSQQHYISSALHFRRDNIQNGVAVETRWADKLYSYALRTTGYQPGVEVGGELNGDGWQALAATLPVPADSEAGASIAVKFSLKPGEATTIPFVLSWYAPYWNAMNRDPKWALFEYQNRYASRFQSASQVAGYIATRKESLLKRILAWQSAIYDEAEIPGWLQDSLVNIFGVLPQESLWVTNPRPDDWWGHDGLFTVNESRIACPQQSCMVNDSVGEWTIDIFFPKLALNKLRPFRYYQKPNGEPPSTLGSGTEPNEPWYDQQLTMDGQVYVQMVDRYLQITSDTSILATWYPSVKKAMQFMFNLDHERTGLPEVSGDNQYYDSWPTMAGSAIHVSTYWLSTLRIVERMANQAGDHEFADVCRAWYEKGSRSMERDLWNPAAQSYFLYNQPSTGKRSDTILSDQLIGEFLVRLHGLEPIIPQDRVRTVLGTIWQNNMSTYGVRLAMKPGGKPDEDGFYSTAIHPSYSTIVPAALQMWEGDPDKGLALMQRTWGHLILDLKMAWDQPGGLNPDGTHRWGLQYYHNTMLWTVPVAALNTNLRAFSSPGGWAYRIKSAARGEGGGAAAPPDHITPRTRRDAAVQN
jgi:non-lysosomal glucosylceramidase